jgi:NitT/TauT family transport system ATP-binding protein
LPTIYPKCTPSEMMGLLVLLKGHNGAEDLARLADDLDLEIDEILPATEFAETLQLIKLAEGRATLTDTGKRLLDASIRERKALLRDQLKRTTFFRTLLQALENSPERRLGEDALNSLVEFTTVPADELVQNIINWGRFAELFRYDAEQRVLLPSRARSSTRTGPEGGGKPPASTSPETAPKPPRASSSSPPHSPPATVPIGSVS